MNEGVSHAAALISMCIKRAVGGKGWMVLHDRGEFDTGDFAPIVGEVLRNDKGSPGGIAMVI